MGELLAQHFLIEKGYQIIQNNFRIRGGEIDLIAKLNQRLIFFEIKTRRSSTPISEADEQISFRQQRLLQHAARHFIFRNRHSALPFDLQFDLLVIHWDSATQPTQAKIKHLKNIFSE